MLLALHGKFFFPAFESPCLYLSPDLYLPFTGTGSKDMYGTGNKAALVGGTSRRRRNTKQGKS
jgi:hypothetical protein